MASRNAFNSNDDAKRAPLLAEQFEFSENDEKQFLAEHSIQMSEFKDEKEVPVSSSAIDLPQEISKLGQLQASMKPKVMAKRCSYTGWPIGLSTFLTGMGVLVKPFLDYYNRFDTNIQAHETIRDEILNLYRNRSTLLNITCPAPEAPFWMHPEHHRGVHVFQVMSDYCGERHLRFVQEMIDSLDELCAKFMEDWCAEMGVLSELSGNKVMSIVIYAAIALSVLVCVSSAVSFGVDKCREKSKLDQTQQNELDRNGITYDKNNITGAYESVRKRKLATEMNRDMSEIIALNLPRFPITVCEIIYSYAQRPMFFSQQSSSPPKMLLLKEEKPQEEPSNQPRLRGGSE